DKWLTNIPPEAPVSRIARRAIGSRLRAVAHYLAQAGQTKKPAKDDVHQLRIWTRRAAAALRLFDPLVPAKRGGPLKKTLKKLRRAAGRVRDCDVFLDQLEASGNQSPRMIEALRSQRRQARRALRARCGRLLD
ncbi:CHAD domain-containing protein, partial [Klebsiella pneumoniae]|uniref:CHAD domain-containing protein n=1 Tax=Klebsiella pneumoniae TaxID=573 RepID=UPI0013D28AD8